MQENDVIVSESEFRMIVIFTEVHNISEKKNPTLRDGISRFSKIMMNFRENYIHTKFRLRNYHIVFLAYLYGY